MHIDIIEKRLKRLKKNWPNKKLILFRHKALIKKETRLILAKCINKDDLLYMRFPDEGKIFIGYGKAIKYSSKNNFTQFSNKTYNIKSNIKKDHIDIFGGAAFNLKKLTSFPWEHIPKTQFSIPKFLFSFTKNKTHLTYSCLISKHFKIKNILNDIESCNNDLNAKPIKEKNKIKLTKKHLILNKKEYLEKIKFIKKKITQKEFKKVVLSRIERYNIPKDVDFHTTMESINKIYPDCFNFLIKFKKDEYLIGSSPEKIITKKKLSYTTTAIAGTSRSNNILKDKKEIEEHNYVIQHLKHVLKKHSRRITISKPKLLNLNYANHIQTHIKGQTLYNIHVLELLNEIYPTPALSGVPMNKSLKIIHELESFSRGWYAGAIGMYNSNGDGSFYVPIRSALIKKDKIFLYSGGGIVKDSNGEKEWEETKVKLQHLRYIFN